MKIASLVQRSHLDFEERKRALARKEMDQAYKKHAKFAEASKNPILVAMENLLSGKTEKELHEQELEGKHFSSEQQFTHEEKLPLLDDTKHLPSGEVSIQALSTNDVEETIEILEKVRQAALAPADPSPQDLRVAASAIAQIQAARGEVIEEANEEEPFVNESFDVEIPERFTAEVVRQANEPTVFGRDLEKELVTRTFNKAKSIYTSHIEMVKNSYRSYNEPKFSITA